MLEINKNYFPFSKNHTIIFFFLNTRMCTLSEGVEVKHIYRQVFIFISYKDAYFLMKVLG